MIPVEQIARLAEYYDRYNNALDPFSNDCLLAKRQFHEFASSLHSSHAPDINFVDFRLELIRHCREYLHRGRKVGIKDAVRIAVLAKAPHSCAFEHFDTGDVVTIDGGVNSRVMGRFRA